MCFVRTLDLVWSCRNAKRSLSTPAIPLLSQINNSSTLPSVDPTPQGCFGKSTIISPNVNIWREKKKRSSYFKNQMYDAGYHFKSWQLQLIFSASQKRAILAQSRILNMENKILFGRERKAKLKFVHWIRCENVTLPSQVFFFLCWPLLLFKKKTKLHNSLEQFLSLSNSTITLVY